ncbi:MAG: hypothetical protein WA775_11375 [Psychroserpens sp.]|uniref:TlpA family protein disulfide reductase n=1 Tax=Psychroserpens sp. TaxID=2020870 RepID=UPI003C78801F
MKFYTVTLLMMFLLASCASNSKLEDGAYFGGEIINPNNNYITFFSNETERDTIFLDKNNRFLHKIEDLNPGLYSFTHGGEYQSILIEPNDSILFRLNTNDFDESLVYTGRGSIKNNFLIKAYLNDEVESKKFSNKQHLEPEQFEKVITSIRKQKIENLDQFITTHETSELFKKIASAGIDYSYYTYKEMYPFGYFGNNKLIHVKDLPVDFYSFRSNIDFNDESLSRLYAYNRFMLWHFQNIALQNYYEDGSHHKFDRHALDYNLDKLRLIDETIENEMIKNYVLMYVTREFIFNSSNAEKSKSMLEAYLEKSSDKANNSYLTGLVASTINLFPGNKIPAIKIIDFNNNTVDLQSVIKEPTVIYCWSSNFKMSYRNNHFMMKSLKAQYPHMNFIAINVNDMDTETWKETLKFLKYPTQNEYIFKNSNEAIKTFAIAYSQKVIIVDENGKIIKANADLFSNDIGTQIESVLASN